MNALSFVEDRPVMPLTGLNFHGFPFFHQISRKYFMGKETNNYLFLTIKSLASLLRGHCASEELSMNFCCFWKNIVLRFGGEL